MWGLICRYLVGVFRLSDLMLLLSTNFTLKINFQSFLYVLSSVSLFTFCEKKGNLKEMFVLQNSSGCNSDAFLLSFPFRL